MKIVTVCGLGVGSSVLLKMNAEQVLAGLNVAADVEALDLTTARSEARRADIVLTSAELATELGDIPTTVITINYFTSLPEITTKLSQVLIEKELLPHP